MESTHPVLNWPLDGTSYDVVVLYKVRQAPTDAGIKQTFRCKAVNYMGFQDATVRLDKDRKLLILEKYESSEDAPTQPVLIGRLLVPLEEVVAIIAQSRKESLDEPDKIGPLLCWPEDNSPLVRELITAGFKP